MPAEFTGAVIEHKAVRESVGVFDLSHLGKLVVTGDDPAEVLNRCLTNDVHHLTSPGKAQYTLACTEDGGVIADLMLYRFDRTSFMMFPSGAGWLEFAKLLHRTVGDELDIGVNHDSHGIVSLQGPQAAATLRRLGMPAPQEYAFFETSQTPWGGAFVCCSGFTGEDGYEITASNDVIASIWDALVAEGATPCGMRAHDSLRLEMGYPLHGTDFDITVTAVEARLAWAIGWNKPEFWGQEALNEQRTTTARRRLFGVVASAAAPLSSGMPLYDGDRQVGHITSAAHSPTLDKTVGLAMFEPIYEAGTVLEIDTADGRLNVTVTKPPFITTS